MLIAFAVLTGVFFVITVVAIVFCVKRGKNETLKASEAIFQSETTEIVDEKKYGKLM